MPILFFLALFMVLDFAALFALGSHIGLLATLAIMLASAMLGLHLIRREGMDTLRHAQARFLQGEANSSELMQGTTYIIAGLMLLAPGTLTDVLGLLLLLPVSRALLKRQLEGRTSRADVFMSRKYGPRRGGDSADFGEHDTSRRQNGSDAPLEGEYIERGDHKK